MNNKQRSGWKHPGRNSSDYSRSSTHDHDRRSYGAAQDFSHMGPRGYNRDQKIHDQVCEALKWHPDVDATHIMVKVRHNKVYLDGVVDSRHAKKKAEQIADEIFGVADVLNYLEISKTLDVDSDKIISRGEDGLFTSESIKEH